MIKTHNKTTLNSFSLKHVLTFGIKLSETFSQVLTLQDKLAL